MSVSGQVKLNSELTSCIVEPDTVDGQQAFQVVEKMPQYPGGQSALYRDLYQNADFPKEEIEFRGKVYVTFLIDTTGRIRNECIIPRYGKDKIMAVEKEALRLVRLLKQWTPGEQNGRKVPVRSHLAVEFNIK